jgi:hypothetical protein
MQSTVVICDIDYVVINCRYTNRLIEHVEKIKSDAESWDAQLLQIGPDAYNTTDIDIDDLFEFLAGQGMCRIDDSVVYECDTLSTAMTMCSELTAYNHCAFFELQYIQEIRQYTYQDKTVLVLLFDTESG